MPIKLKPVGEYILCKLHEWKPSNIIDIPDVCKKGYRQECEIIAVPPFRIHKKTGTQYPFQVQAGQRVLIHPIHSDRKIDLDGEQFCFLEEKDMVGIIERTEGEP